MSYPFGITGIGSNPYMNGLGSFGLGAGGTYSSIGDMSSMGMAGYGMNGMGAMMGMPGMMGMYNPSFMGQMNKSYQEIEKQNLEHAGAMHKLMLQTQAQNYRADDEYLFQKSLEDATEGDIMLLAEKIREGDADGICEQFDKLKSKLYAKHADYLKANSDRINPSESVNNIIANMYAQIVTAKTGQVASLRNDIKQYGETAFKHGFNKNFFGKKDYHNNYSEETLSYLFGTRIDNKSGKDRMETFGGAAGRVAEGATATVAGYGAGLGVAAAGSLIPFVRKSMSTAVARDEAGKIITQAGKAIKESTLGNWLKRAGVAGTIFAGLALAGDILWQMSRD